MDMSMPFARTGVPDSNSISTNAGSSGQSFGARVSV
jgi:hypothetical protein